MAAVMAGSKWQCKRHRKWKIPAEVRKRIKMRDLL